MPLPAGTYEISDEKQLSQLVAQAFSQRRKTIRNSLRKVVDEATLVSVGIDPGLRPEAIPIADYVRLANTLE
jgi:16S rRNA (adenine1518-N6/adenine1519-N6)-dimethyltransferase